MQTAKRPDRVSRREALTAAGLSVGALDLAGTAAAQAKAPTGHERVDTMVLQDGTNAGSGTRFGVFSVADGKIHEFIDVQID